MVSLTSYVRTHPLPPHPLFLFNPKVPTNPPPHRLLPHFKFRPLRFHIPLGTTPTNNSTPFVSNSLNEPPPQQQQPPRTLFPGGYKRAQIKVPNVVLQLSAEEILEDTIGVLDLVDEAVANRVGIVVLNGGGASGGKLYEAACLIKSVIRDRAYLLIDERVDIAAAVNASGVLLSDQGLPAIVARNMMIGSKSDSVILPLVARNVRTTNAALDASKSEGADFLIYTIFEESQSQELVSAVLKNVRIPTFVMNGSVSSEKSFKKMSYLLTSGASGFVISLQELKLLGSNDLGKLFDSIYLLNEKNDAKAQSSDKPSILDTNNGLPGKSGVAGFTKLEERVREFIETERSVLLEAINVIQQAAPLMEDVSLLIDAVSQLDEPFLLVIVVIVC